MRTTEHVAVWTGGSAYNLNLLSCDPIVAVIAFRSILSRNLSFCSPWKNFRILEWVSLHGYLSPEREVESSLFASQQEGVEGNYSVHTAKYHVTGFGAVLEMDICPAVDLIFSLGYLQMTVGEVERETVYS